MIDFKDIKALLDQCTVYSFYRLNAIPEKKLNNARLYMNIPRNETIYGLYDSTIFGSAKEGTCFTEKKIYGRSVGSVESISYDEFAKAKISWYNNSLIVNGKSPAYASDVLNDLFKAIIKLGAPIDLNDAKTKFNQKKYQECIEALDGQIKHISNTEKRNVIEYRKLYIESYIGLNDIAKSEELLDIFKKEYASEESTSEFINKTDKIISDYHNKYNEDVQVLKATLAKADELEKDGNHQDALQIIYNQKLREDFSSDLKKEYYDKRINIELQTEDPKSAEKSIKKAASNKIISSKEKSDYNKRLSELKAVLKEREFEQQREVFRKNIATARMFEKYGVLESASDTIIAVISSAPSNLEDEKAEAFRILVELLLSQYEYDQIYELSKFYSSLSSADKLGYDLSKTVEQHKADHADEFYEHLYKKAIYYMQVGKYTESAKYIKNAKSVKSTLDIACAEINLAILELDYSRSRYLLDLLIKEKAKYEDIRLVENSIDQLEGQYLEMICGISDFLKTNVIHNNTDILVNNNGYNDFVDLEGLNLPAIAARFTNTDVLSALKEHNCNTDSARATGGFGVAFLAAMQLDYEAFKKYISKRSETIEIFVINEPMNIQFALSDEVNRIAEERAVTKEAATDIAIKNLYTQCILLYVCILSKEYNDIILSKLNNEKENQIALVETMKEELPSTLQRIDDEYSEKCNKLSAAIDEIKSLISDVPSSREEKAAAVTSELEQVINSSIQFVNKNAQIMKDEHNWLVSINDQYIDKIQQTIDLWSSLDKDVVKNLFKIPSSAIVFEEYLADSGKLRLNLLGKSLEIEASSAMADALMENSPNVAIDSRIDFEFTAESFNVTYTYSFSVGEEKSVATFTNSAAIENNKVIEEIAMEIFLPEKS